MIAEQTTDYKSEGAGYGFGVQPKLVRNERVPRPCSGGNGIFIRRQWKHDHRFRQQHSFDTVYLELGFDF